MTEIAAGHDRHETDTAPGDQHHDAGKIIHGLRAYALGLALATLLTVMSFTVARTTLVWQPSIPVALLVLAIAQMGVHVLFFLHVTSGPDSTNNIMALAFGVLIVALLIGGSVWIMDHLNHAMMPMAEIMRMQR